MSKAKWIGFVIGAAAIAAAVFLFLKLSDHTAEFRDALMSGNVSRVESLLKKHPSLANATGMDFSHANWGKPVVTEGWTPLHLAAYMGDAEMIKLLARNHAKMNQKDKGGLTPLLWTAFGGKHEAAAALLANGADINARGRDGRSTLDLAKLSLDDKLIELLRRNGAKE